MILISILCLLLIGALLAGWVVRLPRLWHAWVLPVPALLAFLLLIIPGLSGVSREGRIGFRTEWVPQIGLDFALSLNGIGLLLALLVTGIGTLILIYATGYMAGHAMAGRLYAYLYAFMLAMTGLAVADHLLLFFIFWELTSITSYLLIGFNHASADSRKKALQALVVTGLGGMALLGGFILLANAAGTWYLSELQGKGAMVAAHPHYTAILILVLLGAFTKSAQFPFHFWLPNAMAAPTPVSAYLHSATMVKAGIFLMAVMLPVLGTTDLWTALLVAFGGITLLTGGVFGLQQNDLKAILAGTTLAVLGLLTLLLGIGSEKDVLAALLFLVGHALYKASLFMVAGSVDHETGTRDTRYLAGLGKLMPWTAAAATLAAFSKMGLPPFFGFLGKEYTYKASLGTEMEWVLTGVLIVGNAMILALAVKVAIIPFWFSKGAQLPKKPHEAPWSMRFGPLLLAVLGIVIGLFPGLIEPVLGPAKSAVLGYPASPDVKAWQGFNLPLLLSAFTLLIGLVIATYHKPIRRTIDEHAVPFTERSYDWIMEGTLRLANWQTRILQSGLLRNYLLTIIVSTCTLILLKLWRFGAVPMFEYGTVVTPVMLATALLMFVGMGLAITTNSRLTALVSLGAVGYGVALIFALFSAPDLAITQILVETLTVVLFAWVVYRLPGFRTYSTRRVLLWDALVAGVVGILVTVLVLKSKTLEMGPSISERLAEWSLPEAYGANVVNVILVDFRALDTWGEITVLAIAAIGVWALARNAPKIGKSSNGRKT